MVTRASGDQGVHTLRPFSPLVEDFPFAVRALMSPQKHRSDQREYAERKPRRDRRVVGNGVALSASRPNSYTTAELRTEFPASCVGNSFKKHGFSMGWRVEGEASYREVAAVSRLSGKLPGGEPFAAASQHSQPRVHLGVLPSAECCPRRGSC